MLPVTFVVAYTGCGSSELLVLDWSLEVNCIVYLLIISLSAVLTYFTVFLFRVFERFYKVVH